MALQCSSTSFRLRAVVTSDVKRVLACAPRALPGHDIPCCRGSGVELSHFYSTRRSSSMADESELPLSATGRTIPALIFLQICLQITQILPLATPVQNSLSS